ncbi:MAG TPA: phage portal protein [Dissulfurispiraceae bacterium]|nr:phage portal protein [Dissulfurispiraceae bacterium]
MRLFGFEIKRLRPIKARNYAAAKVDNLTADWLTSGQTSDEILRWSLSRMRERSRELSQNNDYMKNFLRKLRINVVGPNGISMQSKARKMNGVLDKTKNDLIEAAWREFNKRGSFSVCGTMGGRDFLCAALESVARDGDVLIRKVRGYDNAFRFALQLIEADYLDETYNEARPDGSRIVMGIEKNLWGRPIAYYLRTSHPGDSMQKGGPRHIRVPADEIVHPFIRDRATQSRGVPWGHSAIIRLRMLGAYEEAAIVNARVGASKMQSIIMGEGQDYTEGEPRDEYGNIVQEVEPGMREVLPFGTQIHDTMPPFPSAEHGIFTKAMLRGISSGFGCSYNSLANDLEGVNFSSLRSGLLEERDGWKALQAWFIENVLDEIYPAWLDMAILSGQLAINASTTDRLKAAPKWQPRRWEWVDPGKDIAARIDALGAKLTTRTRICAEVGEDFEDILEELAAEELMAKSFGVDLSLDASAARPAKDPPKEGKDAE